MSWKRHGSMIIPIPSVADYRFCHEQEIEKGGPRKEKRKKKKRKKKKREKQKEKGGWIRTRDLPEKMQKKNQWRIRTS